MKDIVNTKEIKRAHEHYIIAKKQLEQFIFDLDYVKEFVNVCYERNVLHPSKIVEEQENGHNIIDEDGNFSFEFRIWLWREIWLVAYDKKYNFDFKYYQAIKGLLKMKIS